jgi:glycosyltransferase involved in cell wall biosynthesis
VTHVVFVDRAGAKSIWELMGHVARKLLEQGHRATFVLWDDGLQAYSQEVPPGVDQVTVRVPRKKHAYDILRQHAVFGRAFRGVLRELRPDVVHTNFAVPSIIARLVSAQENVPLLVSTQHELYGSMSSHYRLGLRWTEHYCDAVTYVSNAVARSFVRDASVASAPVTGSRPWHIVIPNGTNLQRIQSVTKDVRDRIPGRIVCVGRMVPVKGQHLLIDALPRALSRHPHLNVRLIGSGPMEAGLRQQVRRSGLESCVEFAGWLGPDEVLREIAAAELVVVPSDGTQEGYGLVVAEAASCGTPLLVSDIAVFREVLNTPGTRDRFFAPYTSSALAQHLRDFDFSPPGSRPPRHDSVTRVKGIASAGEMASEYLRVYASLTKDFVS